MNYEKAMKKWEKILKETNLVKETLEEKDFKDILCRIESHEEKDSIKIDIYDFENLQHYVILFKDGKIDAYAGLGNQKMLVEEMKPFKIKSFYELTQKLVDKTLLGIKRNRMNKDDLFAIEDYTILMQYLALGYKIKVNNGMADIEIWMEDVYKIKGLNLNFKDLPPYNYSEEMTLENVILGIIPQLKEQEPEEFKTFENRWEEIKSITLETVALNKMAKY